MGNSSTKEQRPLNSPSSATSPTSPEADQFGRTNSNSNSSEMEAQFPPPAADRAASSSYSSRHGRGADLSFLGLGAGSERERERETAAVELRRESKQEREARRAEKERIAREKERERSMRQESVDGGYLVTQGVYTGPEDFNKAIVRQLMIERRLAPFFKGVDDYDSAWSDERLVAAVRGESVAAAVDARSAQAPTPPRVSRLEPASASADTRLAAGTVPIAPRSLSFNADHATSLSPSHPAFSLTSAHPAAAVTTSSSSSIFRPRSKTLASLTTLSRNHSSEMTPQEIALPPLPAVDGRPLLAFLYRDASECPICFLYYPAYLNRTRCCDQAICSECFVQIKRADPHPPEHGDASAAAAAATHAARLGERDDAAEALVCEPAACPFCVQPEFGITYEAPPFRSGLAYANHPSAHPLAHAHAPSAMSSSSSLSSYPGSLEGALSAAMAPRRRTTSLSAVSPAVITTDRIRPDWAQKLANARAHVARRSAAATALHTAAYLMGGITGGDGRGFGPFGRRGRLNRHGGGSDAPPVVTRTLLHPRAAEDASASSPPDPAPAAAVRRSRLDDLEEMMMMEAIRRSLVVEEERKANEAKDAAASAPAHAPSAGPSRPDDARSGASAASSSGPPRAAPAVAVSPKGKAVDRRSVKRAGPSPEGAEPARTAAPGASASSEADEAPGPAAARAPASSGVHGRVASTTRGGASSRERGTGSASRPSEAGSIASSTTAPSTTTTAAGPVMNFASLAAVIGDDEEIRERGGGGGGGGGGRRPLRPHDVGEPDAKIGAHAVSHAVLDEPGPGLLRSGLSRP
ncbi:MAG: SNF1-interacting protein [Phylliscum demangeonii]|nr:MAG: SNF1-interacting protein [Phylliscum demangeonii]